MAKIPNVIGGAAPAIQRSGVTGGVVDFNVKVPDIASAGYELGRKIQDRKDKLTYSSEKANFMTAAQNAMSEIGEGDDLEFETYGARYSDLMQEAKKEAAGKIGNNILREQFEIDADLEITHGNNAMAKKSWAREKDTGMASLNEDISTYRELYINGSGDRALKGAMESIDTAYQNGYINKAKKGDLAKKVGENFAIGWLTVQPTQKQIELLESGEGVASVIPTDQRKVMLDRLDRRGIAQGYADAIIETVATPKEQLAAAREIDDPKARADTVSLIKTRINEDIALTNQVEKESFEEGKGYLVKDEPIPSEVWESMNPRDQLWTRDYLEARSQKKAKGRTKDDLPTYMTVQAKINNGDIQDPEDLLIYDPLLTNTTIKTLTKQIQKREVVKEPDMRKAFELRTKGRINKNNSLRVEYKAFQDFVLDNVDVSGRARDLSSVADEWFMKGYTAEDHFGFDPVTVGEAYIEGREDFIIEAPELKQESVGEALGVLSGLGSDVANLGGDQFFNDFYMEGERYLRASGLPTSPTFIAAYALQKRHGAPITLEEIVELEQDIRVNMK